jgi:hypothetical protein
MYTDIYNGMYKAFFADAFATMVEEQGFNFPSGSDIMDYIPEGIDKGAQGHARLLYLKMCIKFTDEFMESIEHTVWEEFGHYCAMQAMGHGVGLSDFAYTWNLDDEKMPEVPRMESCELEKFYYGLDALVIEFNKEGYAWIEIEDEDEGTLRLMVCADCLYNENDDEPINITSFVSKPSDAHYCLCEFCGAESTTHLKV